VRPTGRLELSYPRGVLYFGTERKEKRALPQRENRLRFRQGALYELDERFTASREVGGSEPITSPAGGCWIDSAETHSGTKEVGSRCTTRETNTPAKMAPQRADEMMP
jgi:hypothetical protein